VADLEGKLAAFETQSNDARAGLLLLRKAAGLLHIYEPAVIWKTPVHRMGWVAADRLRAITGADLPAHQLFRQCGLPWVEADRRGAGDVVSIAGISEQMRLPLRMPRGSTIGDWLTEAFERFRATEPTALALANEFEALWRHSNPFGDVTCYDSDDRVQTAMGYSVHMMHLLNDLERKVPKEPTEFPKAENGSTNYDKELLIQWMLSVADHRLMQHARGVEPLAQQIVGIAGVEPGVVHNGTDIVNHVKERIASAFGGLSARPPIDEASVWDISNAVRESLDMPPQTVASPSQLQRVGEALWPPATLIQPQVLAL
jgi:hypothetical protein